MNIDAVELGRWRGRTEQGSDVAAVGPVHGLAALLDLDREYGDGDSLPPPAHWLYFLPAVRQSEMGEDGHPRRGGFLPPVPLPRRMWAGSRIEFHRSLKMGARISRLSRIADVTSKQGRSGALVFVRVTHEIRDDEGLVITEEQDIVYRDTPSGQAPGQPPAAGEPAPAEQEWVREIKPDPVLLFRFSALTFNGHRIHYDRPYATQAEGYPGLVVHGPLIATLLLDLVHRSIPAASVRSFSFRAVMPLFDLSRFFVCGRRESQSVRLWAKDERGMLAMDAQAVLA